MSELRLSLLALGLLFIAALAGWDWWRRRRAAQENSLGQAGATAIPAVDTSPARATESFTAQREPVLGDLPIIDVGRDLDAHIRADVDLYGMNDRTGDSELGIATVVLPAGSIEADSIETGPPVRVEWPEEAERQIIGLRVVSRPGARFSGLRLRQALVGDGFIHGDFRIFHRPGADGRAVVSAASLTKPGYFELDRMDNQTFAGLNLFAVLPGPAPGAQAFEVLLGSARALAQRLGGDLADGSGAPLTDEKAHEMRARLRDPKPMARAAGGA
jgi:hypothetical protein